MDFFRKAKTVRLISYKDKCLTAEEDQETVTQSDLDRSSDNVQWTVEFVDGKDYIRLKSCFGTYLTASSIPILPGGARVSGKKVVQTKPAANYCDPATEWQPLRDGMQVKLRSFWCHYLRPNGGLPPWRNYITHDVPHLPTTRNKLLWDVEVVEKRPLNEQRPLDQNDNNKFTRLRSKSFSEAMGGLDLHKQSVNMAVQKCA